MFDKPQNKELSWFNLFSFVQIVDKTKIVEDVHEYNDNINDTNLVLASDVIETIMEAFEEEENVAVRDTDQESRGNTAKNPPWIRNG